MAKTKRVAVLAGIVVATGAIACVGSILNGVHFNDGKPDFGAPPPPIVLTVWGETQDRAGLTQDGDGTETREADYDAQAKAEKEAEDHRAALRKDGMAKEATGDFAGATAAYEEMLKSGKAEDAESVIDRIEVMREAKTPSPLAMEYLSVRRTLASAMPDQSGSGDAYTKAVAQAKVIEGQAVQSFKAILANPVAGFLKAHASYALASIEFDNRHLPAAIELYKQSAAAGGPRRERALIMAARCLLWAKDVPDGKTWEAAPAPPEAALTEAEAMLQSYQKEFPNGRYAVNAEGLQARILFLRRRSPAALAVYLRQLEKAKPEDEAGILASIRASIQGFTPVQAKEMQESLQKNPDLLSPYLDYRLYHTSVTPADLAHLITFVKQALTANPTTPLSGSVFARLAEIELLRHNAKEAQIYAERSLASSDPGKKDLAHYVLGSCLKVAGDLQGSIREYRAVLNTPASYLSSAARENLALDYELVGPWNSALDQYWELGYSYDVAYLLDARLTPVEIEKVIQTRGPKDEHHDLLVFSLGMRYLRLDEFERARNLFKSLPPDKLAALSHKGSRDYSWNSDDKSDTTDTLYDPADTATDLIRLRDAAAKASGEEAKAAARYELASYYYSHRNLLLYNAALWEGGRNWAFGYSWNEKIARPGDNLAVQTHHFEHEALYRARKICLAVAADYPKSKVAAKALYRAATAGRRLANFNGWWRDRNKKQDLYEDAAKLMERVAAEYPSDPLAKNARKYAKVFREEGKGASQSAMFTAAPLP